MANLRNSKLSIRTTNFRWGLDIESPDHEMPEGTVRRAENVRIETGAGIRSRLGTEAINSIERLAEVTL